MPYSPLIPKLPSLRDIWIMRKQQNEFRRQQQLAANTEFRRMEINRLHYLQTREKEDFHLVNFVKDFIRHYKALPRSSAYIVMRLIRKSGSSSNLFDFKSGDIDEGVNLYIENYKLLREIGHEVDFTVTIMDGNSPIFTRCFMYNL